MENNVETRDMNPEASLKIIYEMIDSARSKIGNNYYYYLFWGYLVAATALLEFALIQLDYEKHYLVWTILMPAGGLMTAIFYYRSVRSAGTRTFIGTAMAYFWGGWAISFIILLFFTFMQNDLGLILPMIMAMYGLAQFAAGGIMNFRPLIAGAMITWAASVTSYFVPYQAQLLILAGSLVISHIIPGHILKTRSNKQNHV
jgi:hypothetical protein